MKLLLFGPNGQVGSWLKHELGKTDEIVSLGRSEVDLCDARNIETAIIEHRPDVVVNAAAYTAVDRAETDAEVADLVNAVAPAAMANAARKAGAMFFHYSTDYVFSGDAERPYREDDETGPRSVYGETKLAGERAVLASGANSFIFRTSWVYSNHGGNFLNTMLRLSEQRDTLSVVADQIGTPTYARAIAQATAAVMQSLVGGQVDPGATGGVYHMTCTGTTSWHGFAEAIFAEADVTHVQVNPIPTEDYPTPASRPRYSVLDNSKLKRTFDVVLPPWREALQACLAQRDSPGAQSR